MDEKEFDYLNVIPLVDVMLVLLTIVLTTSTFIATGGIQVELPKAAPAEQAAPLTPRTLTIDREGRLWVEAAEVPLDALATALGLLVAIPAVTLYNLLLRRCKVLLLQWDIQHGREGI